MAPRSAACCCGADWQGQRLGADAEADKSLYWPPNKARLTGRLPNRPWRCGKLCSAGARCHSCREDQSVHTHIIRRHARALLFKIQIRYMGCASYHSCREDAHARILTESERTLVHSIVYCLLYSTASSKQTSILAGRWTYRNRCTGRRR